MSNTPPGLRDDQAHGVSQHVYHLHGQYHDVDRSDGRSIGDQACLISQPSVDHSESHSSGKKAPPPPTQLSNDEDDNARRCVANPRVRGQQI